MKNGLVESGKGAEKNMMVGLHWETSKLVATCPLMTTNRRLSKVSWKNRYAKSAPIKRQCFVEVYSFQAAISGKNWQIFISSSSLTPWFAVSEHSNSVIALLKDDQQVLQSKAPFCSVPKSAYCVILLHYTLSEYEYYPS